MARKRRKRGKRSDLEIARRQEANRFSAVMKRKEAELKVLRARIRRKRFIEALRKEDEKRAQAHAAFERKNRSTRPGDSKKFAPVASGGATERRTTERNVAAAARAGDKRPAPKVHSKNSPRAHCKERPLRTSPSMSGGSGRKFIPWCGSDFGSHRRR